MKRGFDWFTGALKLLETFSGQRTNAPPAVPAEAEANELPVQSEAPAPSAPVTAIEVESPIRIEAAPEPEPVDGEGRRDMVRELFNGYWDGMDDKPPTFAERLDAAEDYINERLAERNVGWRLDAETRRQLGLPRSRSPLRSTLPS